MSIKNEVEVRLIASAEQKEMVLNYVKENGTKKFSSMQLDEYYVPFHRDFLKERNAFEWLRIRIEKKGATFCYKHYYPEGEKICSHCKEYETMISDVNALRDILTNLNFTNFITVNKKREIWNCDGYEFCFDTVDDLGEFIEIEKIENAENPIFEKKTLYNMISNWGFSESDCNYTGYPYLLMRKKGLK